MPRAHCTVPCPGTAPWACTALAPQGWAEAGQAFPLSHGGKATLWGLSRPSASLFRSPRLLGIWDIYAINPSITSPPLDGKMQFSFDVVLERYFLFWPVLDVLPQQVPQPAVLVNLLSGISHVPLALLGNTSRSQVCSGVRNPSGARRAAPCPAAGVTGTAGSLAVPALLWPCFWGPGRGRSFPLPCVQAFCISHDPFVFPTVCALTLFFLKTFYFGFTATVQACSILK